MCREIGVDARSFWLRRAQEALKRIGLERIGA